MDGAQQFRRSDQQTNDSVRRRRVRGLEFKFHGRSRDDGRIRRRNELLAACSVSCEAHLRSMSRMRQFAQLDLQMQWSISFYELVEAARPIPTMVPGHQIVKHMYPRKTFQLWPPSRGKITKAPTETSATGDLEEQTMLIAALCSRSWLDRTRISKHSKFAV